MNATGQATWLVHLSATRLRKFSDDGGRRAHNRQIVSRAEKRDQLGYHHLYSLINSQFRLAGHLRELMVCLVVLPLITHAHGGRRMRHYRWEPGGEVGRARLYVTAPVWGFGVSAHGRIWHVQVLFWGLTNKPD